jgi:molecular chaperone GrpE
MYQVPDPPLPAGSAFKVMQPGDMIGERVLRPALVAVAKGGPKAASGNNDNSRSTAQDS